MAAGFEVACGVVRHFKKVRRGPFEVMVNRGMRRAPRKTSLREVTSFLLGWSSSSPARFNLPARNETVYNAARVFCPSLPQLYIMSHCLGHCLWVSCASDQRCLAGRSPAYHQCSPLALQAGRGQGVWEFLCICELKGTTVYSPLYW